MEEIKEKTDDITNLDYLSYINKKIEKTKRLQKTWTDDLEFAIFMAKLLKIREKYYNILQQENVKC